MMDINSFANANNKIENDNKSNIYGNSKFYSCWTK